jgi:hypothetical protein
MRRPVARGGIIPEYSNVRNRGRWFRDNVTAIAPRTILLAMPRQARLDAPDTLHPGMVRGIARTPIFRDDPDRTEFLGRLAALADQGALTIYAWALLPTHGHLLVRTGR